MFDVRCALAQNSWVFLQATFEELRRQLYRPKFDRYIRLDNRERLAHHMSAAAHWVQAGEPAFLC